MKLFLLIVAALCFILSIATIVTFVMLGKVQPTSAQYRLEPYSGLGSGVYQHGTIVKVVDGKPMVVGYFSDRSGVEYPGTLEIKEVR